MNMYTHYIYKIYRKQTIERMEKKAKQLGKTEAQSYFSFLNTRLVMAVILFFLLFFLSPWGYVVAPIGTSLFYLSLEILFLDIPIKKRGKKLEEEAIFFFEVFSLTLETNKNIKVAIELTSRTIDNELAKEFQKTLADVKMGKSFTESLEDMKERMPSSAINNILLSLIEASIYGNPITETLDNQLEYMKEAQLLETKAEISKLPTKISIISVVFFIPIMLLIILAPVLIDFLLK